MARLDYHYEEVIPGMQKQGEGIKLHVDAEYAPLKAAVVGNTASAVVANPDSWEMQNLFKHSSGILKKLGREHGGKMLKDADPRLYDKVVAESNGLADTLREHGVQVVRYNQDSLPDNLLNYNYSWSKQKQMTFLGHGGGDVVGNCLISVWEVTTNSIQEIMVRDAINEIMLSNPEAVWLTMPAAFPTVDRRPVGPFSCADFLVFEGTVYVGIGVEDPAQMDDTTVPRSANDEYTTETMRRLLKPYGWAVKPWYFSSKFSYHIDCVLKPVDRGLMVFPEGSVWHVPDELEDWEVIHVDPEEQAKGACNCVALGNKKVVLVKGCPRLVKDLEKRDFDVIEIDYETIWNMSGSGIHCSVMQLWREF